MILTRSASSAQEAAPARTGSHDSDDGVTSTRDPHQDKHAHEHAKRTVAAESDTAMPFQRGQSPLFGADDSTGGINWDRLFAEQQNACTADELAQFLNEDLFGTASGANPVAVNPEATLRQPPPQGPPLIPLASRPRTSGQPLSFPDVNAPLSFEHAQSRATDLDGSLASPLFDQGSPYDPLGGAASSAWDGSPAFSDVSPLWSDRGDEFSGSLSPEVRDLQLFGALSVGAPAAKTEAYSPVLAPTQLADIEVSPAAPLPPLALGPAPAFAFSAPAPAAQPIPRELLPPLPPLPAAAPASMPSPSPASASSRQSTPSDSDWAPSFAAAAAPSRPRRTSTRAASISAPPFDPTAPRVAPDAPIKQRKYHVESRTAAKPIPKHLAEQRARAIARGEDAPDDDELERKAAQAREKNTLAARKSREKKKGELEAMKRRVEELEGENDALRAVNEVLSRELGAERAGKRRRVE
ncbi:hypothetical protein JCM10449v2_006472 [Rhodotorula kratochvilovae]